ncbi:hypothetical protein GQX73_g6177 [Xylaria multiplex]|uniref:Uncharacterized protein n=1 Tax=Xylaria multiplex TaxID=323545 RepID=A0A7C8IVF9_9PEZI|nr:hypothetical protein GQX73_g6177 [Xylaria multiplex]
MNRQAQTGETDKVRQLLQNGADVDANDIANANQTALHKAAANGRDEIVELLLVKGANINAKDDSGRTALHGAVENKHYEVARRLLDSKSEVNVGDNSKQTALHRAAENGHEAVVELLLKYGANVDAEDHSGRIALHLASAKGRKETVQRLLATSVNVDVKDNSGWTALHWAARNNHETVVELLLGKADITAEDISKQTALHLAAKEGHENAIKVLLEGGANPDVEDNARQTPLSLAAMNGHAKAVQHLLEKGAKVIIKGIRAKESQNWGVEMVERAVVGPLLDKEADLNVGGISLEMGLRWVAANGFMTGLVLILDKGVDVNARANDGRTALHWAAVNGHDPVVSFLLDETANINAEDNSGKTPLHWAAIGGHRKVVEVLLNKRAKVNIRDNDGRTPLHRATENEHPGVVQSLLQNGADANAKITTPKITTTQEDSSYIIPGQYIITLQPHVSETQAEAHVNYIEGLSITSSDTHSSPSAVVGITHIPKAPESSRIASSDDMPESGAGKGLRHRFGFPGLRGYSGSFNKATLDQIKNSWEVGRIEPNSYGYAAGIQTQQGVPSWGLARMCRNGPINPRNQDGDMTYTYSPPNGDGTFAYVIDSGVNGEHKEFRAGCVLQGINSNADSNDTGTGDAHGHGTHIAGIIAGITCGVAKEAKIIPVKASHGSATNALNEAIAELVSQGISVVVAAGNFGIDASQISPASTPEAIVVGATTIEDTMAEYSNYGKCIDILAPGSNIISAAINGELGPDSGTSMVMYSMCTCYWVGLLLDSDA